MNQLYTEKASAMQHEARNAAIQLLRDQFTEFKKTVKLGQISVVQSVNMARAMGDTIWEITGHQKLLPAEFNQLALALPDAGLAFAKECLSIRRQLDEPVKDYDEAKPIWEKLLTQLELISTDERKQVAHHKEPIEDFLQKVIRIKTESIRLFQTEPIEKWPSFYRQTFIREAQPIHDLYEQALKLATPAKA